MSVALLFDAKRSFMPLAPYPLVEAQVRFREDVAGYELRVETDQAHGYDVEFHRLVVPISRVALRSVTTYSDFEALVRPIIKRAHDELLGMCCERWRVIAEPLGLKPIHGAKEKA